jgi:hypothetical protein
MSDQKASKYYAAEEEQQMKKVLNLFHAHELTAGVFMGDVKAFKAANRF